MRAPVSPGDAHEALRAGERHFGRAPDRVRARIAFDAQTLPLAQHRLVLGMERGAAARAAQDVGDAFVVLDEERAGGRAHEHLDADGAGQALQLRHVLGILMRAADPEGEVAMHAVMAAPHLVGERLGRRGLRIGVGHLEHGGHAAHDGGAGPRFEILLVVEAGLAEMHLAVDHARQDMQAPALDLPLGGGLRQIADGGDPAGAHADVALHASVVIHDDAAFEDQVEGLGHGNLIP